MLKAERLVPLHAEAGRWWRLIGWRLLPWFVALGAVARAADDGAVSLPPFFVEEKSKAPPWRYVQVPGHEVLSRCSDYATEQVIDAHLRLEKLLDQILPERLRLKLTVPTTFVVVDEGSQPAAAQEGLGRMLQGAEAELPPADFGPGRTLRGSAPVRRYNILPNLRLWDRDAIAVFMFVRRDGFDGKTLSLTPSYISYLLKNRLPALPAWFVGGFLTQYEHVTYEGEEIRLEPIEWISRDATSQLKKDPKTAPAPLPLAEFFVRGAEPREGESRAELLRRWQSQAAAFVRWGLDGKDSPRREALWRFVERSATEGYSDRVFETCFGLTPAAADPQFAAHLVNVVTKTTTFRIRHVPEPDLRLRDATEAEIARIKGDLERMEVTYVKDTFPAAAARYLEQARRTLVRAYERDVREAGFLAVLGLCEVDAGNDAEARTYLEKAIRLGPIRPRAACELARLRLAELRGPLTLADTKLDPAQAVSVLEPLFAARAAEPPQAEVYELIAEVWRASKTPPTRGHLAVLDEGVRYFPRRTRLVRLTAELYERHGFAREAATMAELGRRAATDDETRRYFTELVRRNRGETGR